VVVHAVLGALVKNGGEAALFYIILRPPASLCESLWPGDADPPMPLEGDFDLTIRHAQPGDAAVLAQLMCELGYETTTAEMSQRLKSILSDPRYSTIVAEIDDKLSGMIGTLTHVSYEHNDRSGKVIALVVSNKQRRSGVGRALITAAEKDFARRDVTRVTLTTRFERDEAHRFYEALGYERTGLRFAKKLAPASEERPAKSSVADADEK
jgi:ribosomal protein S18 acetylase RimI-like enzyme